MSTRSGSSQVELVTPLIQRMGRRPLLCCLLQALDVGLKLPAVDPPHAAPTELDPGQLTRTNESIGLGGADAQVGCNIFKGQQARLDSGCSAPPLSGFLHTSNIITGLRRLPDFSSTCCRLAVLAPPSRCGPR
jgi:hypothetical protein